MRQRILARLLHYANSNPPFNRSSFYDLKSRLLRKYARFAGHQIQEITKECWGYRKWDIELGDYRYDDCGPTCVQCGGTGIFDQRWVRLQRWEWCGFVFHCPDGDTRIKPDRVDILGRIEHENYGRLSSEACLWLYLLAGEWSLFRKAMTSSRACGWVWWPLLNVQRVTMELSMFLKRRQCRCGKWYYCNRGKCFHFYCQKCERRMQREPSEVPF